MNELDVEKLLNRFRVEKLRVGTNGWFHATCPFARWKHKSGEDKHPSFGVSIVDKGTSRYRCHACGMGGEVGPRLLWALNRFSGEDFSDIEQWVINTNAPSAEEIQKRLDIAERGIADWNSGPKEVAGIRVSPKVAASLPDLETLPLLSEDVLKTMMHPKFYPDVWEFLTGSGLMPDGETRKKNFKPETIDAFGIRWHPGTERVGIPIRDVKGRLVGISGRAFYKHQKPKFLHSKGFRRDAYVFGEHMLKDADREGNKPGFLVEGFWDVMRLWEKGYWPALGVMGSYTSPMQVEKIVTWTKTVEIVPDGDDPGWEAATRWEKDLVKRKHPVHVAAMPAGMDPDDLSDDLLRDLLGAPASDD